MLKPAQKKKLGDGIVVEWNIGRWGYQWDEKRRVHRYAFFNKDQLNLPDAPEPDYLVEVPDSSAPLKAVEALAHFAQEGDSNPSPGVVGALVNLMLHTGGLDPFEQFDHTPDPDWVPEPVGELTAPGQYL
jgi:hypothetical protein